MDTNPFQIYEDIKPVDYALEAFDMGGMAKYFSGFTHKFVDILSTKLIPFSILHSELNNVLNVLSKHTRTSLENFVVYTPEYVSGKLTPYYETLLEAFGELKDVEKRLLLPLEKWAGLMISDPTFSEKVWINLPVKDNRVQTQLDNLQKHFNSSAGDNIANRYFEDVYVDSNGVKEAYFVLDKLISESMDMLDGKLSAKSKSLSALLTRLADDKNVANKLHDLPDEKIKPITELVLQAAKELELLSIVLFNIKTASYAQKETYKKIMTELKEG